MTEPTGMNGVTVATAERVRQLEDSLMALNTMHLGAVSEFSERIDALRYEQREMQARFIKEASFLRGVIFAQGLLVAGYLTDTLRIILVAGTVGGAIWIVTYLLSQSRWVQRKWRDLRIWWDTRRIRNSGRG